MLKTYPKVVNVQAKPGKQLLVTFENGVRREYDCRPLLETEAFEALKEDVFFGSVKTDPGGYGISWSNDIDLSESELWKYGRPVEPETGKPWESG